MQHLQKRIGLFSALMIVMGSIIGSGIFKKVAPMTLKLQSEGLVLLCWLVAGIVTLFATLTYAEVASRVAQTGGLYSYLREMYGKWVGFTYGWSCFSIIQTASIASIAYVFAESVIRIFGNAYSEKWIAIAAILLLSLINYLGVIFGAIVENIFTVLKILGMILVVYLGFRSSMPVTMEGVHPVANVPHGFALLPALFSAMLGAFWAFDGFNNIGFLGGEVKDAERNIPRALIIGVVGVLFLYLLINLAYFHAMTVPQIMELAKENGVVFALEMVTRIRGAGFGKIVALLLMASTFGATNSSILSSSRIYYAMARDGVFFPIFKKIHPGFGTPSVALLAQAIWASSLVMIGSFDELTDMLIFASFAFYGLGAFGLFQLRKRSEGKFRIPSWIPVIYGIFCIVLVLVNIWETPKQALVGLLLIFSGYPVAYFSMRWNRNERALESSGK